MHTKKHGQSVKDKGDSESRGFGNKGAKGQKGQGSEMN